MSGSPLQSDERKKNLLIWSIVGAVVGGVGGGFGFADPGFNLGAALIGLILGVVIMAALTLFAIGVEAVTPSWLAQLLAGAFFGSLIAGIIWEQKFEQKYQAQLTGLVIGSLVTVLLLNRERITKAVSGKPVNSPTGGPKDPDVKQ